jgi:hypothetical protein
LAVEPAGIGDAEEAAALKNIPVLAVFGDYVDVDARWATLRQTAESYLIMDRNNLEVAGLIQKWLAEQPGLYR